MKEFSEIIGDVRGKGLMIGVELVSNVETKEALPADDVSKIFEHSKDMGVLLGKGGVKGNVITGEEKTIEPMYLRICESIRFFFSGFEN